jgi:hypothetical protein
MRFEPGGEITAGIVPAARRFDLSPVVVGEGPPSTPRGAGNG